MNWFPRTRGDGPQYSGRWLTQQRVPPHPRGWSQTGIRCRARQPGSPAPAGMVRGGPCGCRQRAGFPRTRGDGPIRVLEPSAGHGVPPHPRGWSRRLVVRRLDRNGSPAPAGMVPSIKVSSCPTRGFPRTRGDGPPWIASSRITRSVPPHPRGWSRSAPGDTEMTWGSPAPAGMVRTTAIEVARSAGFPRTRGDGPSLKRSYPSCRAVPPHPRGWSRRRRDVVWPDPGSPAPAGMVR